MTGKTDKEGTEDVEILVSLKCLRNLELPLINCEVSFI